MEGSSWCSTCCHLLFRKNPNFALWPPFQLASPLPCIASVKYVYNVMEFQASAEDGGGVIGRCVPLQAVQRERLEEVAREGRRCDGTGQSGQWIAWWYYSPPLQVAATQYLAPLWSQPSTNQEAVVKGEIYSELINLRISWAPASYHVSFSRNVPILLGVESGGQPISATSMVQAASQSLARGSSGDGEGCCQGRGGVCRTARRSISGNL